MPLEVRHIAVRLRVGDPAPPPPAAGQTPPRLSAEDRAAIVRDCTRAVLAALGRWAER